MVPGHSFTYFSSSQFFIVMMSSIQCCDNFYTTQVLKIVIAVMISIFLIFNPFSRNPLLKSYSVCSDPLEIGPELTMGNPLDNSSNSLQRLWCAALGF